MSRILLMTCILLFSASTKAAEITVSGDFAGDFTGIVTDVGEVSGSYSISFDISAPDAQGQIFDGLSDMFYIFDLEQPVADNTLIVNSFSLNQAVGTPPLGDRLFLAVVLFTPENGFVLTLNAGDREWLEVEPGAFDYFVVALTPDYSQFAELSSFDPLPGGQQSLINQMALALDEPVGVISGQVDVTEASVTVSDSLSVEADLVTGRDSMPTGTVNVTNDGGMLEVTFDAANPLLIFEAHAAAGAIEEGYCDVPQTRKGNPKVGKFEEQEEVGVPGTDSLTLNVNNVFQDGETICVAAHAVVYDPSLAGDDPDNLTGCDTNDDGVVSEDEAFECSEETAWGDGIEFDGNSWATWFEYCVPGDNDVVNSVDIGDAADSMLNASAVSLDGEGDASVTGSVGYCADIGDYYVITAPASGPMDLALTGMEGDLDLYLWEVGDGFPLAASENSGNFDEFISYEAVGGTSYIIEVIPYESAASAYELTIDASVDED